ncbi:WD40-repeat-containing domain protein [Rhypophila decipiens]
MSIEIEKIWAGSPAVTRLQPTHLSCDPKGERIAYASGKVIYLRSIDNPSHSIQYTGHTATTSCATFSPSGYWVASGDISGKVRVWDAIEGVNTKAEYPIISGRINSIAWDGDSTRIIAVGDGRERYGHCFTADSGNSVGEITGHSKAINAVSMKQQRPFKAATVSDDGSMVFMQGAPYKFQGKHLSHKNYVMGTEFSPDGNTLVTVGADRRIQLYDGRTGEMTKEIGSGAHTGTIYAVSWAKDSKKLVTASADQTVRLWDVETDTCLQVWHMGEPGSKSFRDQQVGVVIPRGRSDGLIISLSLNGDLNYLVEGTAEPIKVVQGHNRGIEALGVASDKKLIITGDAEGRVCTWDVSTGVGSAVRGETHSVKVSHFCPAGEGRTYSVGWDDTLRTIDHSTNTFTGSPVKLTAQPKGVAATKDGFVVVALMDGISVYKDYKLLFHHPTNFEPRAVAAYGSDVVVADNVDGIHTYELSSAGIKPTDRVIKSVRPASVLSFSPDGRFLAAGYDSGKIIVYRTKSWEIETDRWSAHTARVLSIAWNSTGTHAVSGALDTNVHVWSIVKPGTRVKAANAHKEGVYGVAWIEGDTKIATTGGDAAVKVWAVKGLQ